MALWFSAVLVSSQPRSGCRLLRPSRLEQTVLNIFNLEIEQRSRSSSVPSWVSGDSGSSSSNCVCAPSREAQGGVTPMPPLCPNGGWYAAGRTSHPFAVTSRARTFGWWTCKVRTETLRGGGGDCLIRHMDSQQSCEPRFSLLRRDQTVFLHLTALTPADSGLYQCRCVGGDQFHLNLNITVTGEYLLHHLCPPCCFCHFKVYLPLHR